MKLKSKVSGEYAQGSLIVDSFPLWESLSFASKYSQSASVPWLFSLFLRFLGDCDLLNKLLFCESSSILSTVDLPSDSTMNVGIIVATEWI